MNCAYGLRFHGLRARSALLYEGPSAWPSVNVACSPLRSPRPARTVGVARALLPLVGGGYLALARDSASATFHTPEPIPDDELVHPHLAPVASFFAAWLGRDTLHAGAFACGDRAIALLGGRTDGKSTTLATLAARGALIVTDDVLVLDEGCALAGPRCIDARAGSVTANGFPARGGDRLRIPLPAIESALPLAGVVSLAWGERVSLRRMGARERIPLLIRHRNDPLGDRPAAPLDLAELPCFELSRPRRPETLPEICDRLVDLAGSL